MQYSKTDTGAAVFPVTDLNLKQTLDCGQSFRWDERPDGSFYGTAFGKTVTARMENDTLYLDGATVKDAKAVWTDYFDLRFDYVAVKDALSQLHPVLREAAAFAPGMHILNQDSWEALCSFIISQNNNIKRIKGIVARLCEGFGEQRDGVYVFPLPETLAKLTPDDLAPIRCGFRAGYLLDAARKVACGEVDLGRIRKMETGKASEELMKIKGVGPKVAQCALLYGMHRLECFPLDVWMKRAMARLFPDLAPEDFGEYAGIAQQYIFHYSRMHPGLFEPAQA